MASWSIVTAIGPNALLQQFRVSEPEEAYHADLQGVNALTGTAVQTFHQGLLGFGLPFRISIRTSVAVAYTYDVDEDTGYVSPALTWRLHVLLPPMTVNPLLAHGLNTWGDFLHLLLQQMTVYSQELEDLPSGVTMVGIAGFQITYVPQDNLAAFQPFLQGMGGGALCDLPPDLVVKKCVLNIKNEDNQCLRCCLICWDLEIYLNDPHNANRWGKYLKNMPKGLKPKGWVPQYIDCSLDLSTMSGNGVFEDIDKVELANPGLGVYVYFWHRVTVGDKSQNFQVLARMPPSPLKVEKEVFLLLHNKHWCLITDFQRFACQRSFAITHFAGTSHAAANCCHRCLQTFSTNGNLQKHKRSCNGVWEQPAQPPRLPSEVKKYDKTHVFFGNWQHTFMHELVCYADIETFFNTVEETSTLRAYGENRGLASIGFHAVGRQGLTVLPEFQAQIFVSDGSCDPFFEFMRKLLRLCIFWRYCRNNAVRLLMRPQDREKFELTPHCEHCGIFFDEKVVKCQDHNHYTGEYRAALCLSCNGKARNPKELRVFTHNGTGYDHHFYLLGLARFMNAGLNLRDFVDAPALWFQGDKESHFDIEISKFNLKVIAESSEKVRCIQFGFRDINIMFLDSLKFVKGKMEKLIESEIKAYPQDLSSGFRNMIMHHPRICQFFTDGTALGRLTLLLKKIPFPYSSMRDAGFWDDAVPRDKKAYRNDLTDEEITDDKYAELLHILDVLNIRTGRELHDVYLNTDVLALADVCENFREKFHDTTGLDPFHKLGLPGAAWDNLLKNSRANIENITQECCDGGGVQLMKYVDANIRGGLSCAFVSHSKANNPNCPGYVECEPKDHIWIKDFDANSLYPFCMSMPLPVGNYKLEGGLDAGHTQEECAAFLDRMLASYTSESKKGYMLVVRLEIPQELHDKWDYAPAVNRPVQWGELSARQQQAKRRKYLSNFHDVQHKARKLASMLKTPGNMKLVPDLGPQDRKAIHIEHAQLLRKHGAVFTALYACYSFDQERVFKSVMEKHSTKRQLSTDEAVRDMEKLCMNSPYGKTLENKRGRRNFNVHTNMDTFRRNACFKRTQEFRIQHYCEEDGTFLGVTSSKKTKQIVLDTPRMMGWAILEYAKMVMGGFHYDVMKPLFGEALKLLYTDTDSMYYEIRWPTDPIDYIAEQNERLQIFDLSQVARYKDTPLKNKLGCFKYEGADNKKGIEGEDNEIVEAVFLAPKSYAKRMAKEKKGKTLEIKGKGVPSAVLKENFGCSLDYYKNALLTNKSEVATFRAFRSKDHIIKHCEVTKVALSAENDKVFQLSPTESRPLGHYKNSLPVAPCPEWDLSDSEDEAVPLALEIIASQQVPQAAIVVEDGGDDTEIEEVSDAESVDWD